MKQSQRANPYLPALVALLLAVWLVLTLRLSEPFYSVDDAMRTWVAGGVRNYDIYGLETTGLMMTRNTAPVAEGESLNFYAHHPPLLMWLPALTTRLVGFHELGMRYIYVVATLLAIALLYAFAKRLFNPRVAFWATLLFALSPMVSYYGQIITFNSLSFVVAFAFASLLYDWLKTPTRKRLILLTGLVALAVWTAWTTVFFIAALSASVLLLGHTQQRITVFGWGFLSIMMFIVLMGFYEVQHSGSIDSLINQFGWRASNATSEPGSQAFTSLEWIEKVSADLLFFGAIGVVLLGFMGIFARRYWTRQSVILVGAMLFAALAYHLVFRSASYIHYHYKAIFMPAIALSGGVAWVYWRYEVGAKLKRYTRPIVDTLLLFALLNTLVVFNLYYSTAYQPQLETTITAIKTQALLEQDVWVYIQDSGPDYWQNYRQVIEFYTFRHVTILMQPPTTIPDGVFLVYCGDSPPPNDKQLGNNCVISYSS